MRNSRHLKRSAGTWFRLWLALWLLPAALAQGGTVTDDRGVTVAVPAQPQRVISLLPSVTESICALGACGRLVGVDDYSNFPQSVSALPHLGGLEDANIERIVALQPDVVLVPLSSRATQRLQALGLRVVALEPKSMADVQRVLGKLGQVLDLTNASALWAQIQRDIAQVAQAVPAQYLGNTVYFEVNSGPYAASESSFMGEIMRTLGLKNIVPASLGPFPKINPEFVVRANPQLIMVSDRHAVALHSRPGWAQIQALQTGRVCQFNAAQGDVLVRPGPRMAQAAQLMLQCIQGKLKP